MSLLPDNFAALLYLKNQCRKWKNIAFLMLIISFLLFFKLISRSSSEPGNIDNDVSKYIATIKIDGIIFDDDYRTKILKKIATQDNIKAVIVNIDSPGGGVVGSEILYNNLREIAKHKPIVTIMGSMAASGGYMAAIASDYIIARNGTLTGSIGVVIQASEITNLADKIGVKFLTYKSSPLKAAPSPFEKTSPKIDQVINESIRDTYEFFSGLVLERRGDKLNKKNLNNIIDGRVFTGRQAIKAGLVDEIGGEAEALSYLKTTAQINVDDIEVKEISIKEEESKFLGQFLGESAVNKFLGLHKKNEQVMAIWDLNNYSIK